MANILVTGGAGFIGTNLVHRLAQQGHHITVFDNLSRPGSEHNIAWLQETHCSEVCFTRGDVRDYASLLAATEGAEIIYHLAAQVAVTSSVVDPRADFEVNALGTFNALEAARYASHDPVFVLASTNKVYGELENSRIDEEHTRYVCRNLPSGVPETQLLDFHSPYGCSKGAADQYAHDYSRIYGLRTVVCRQSCIYGPWQMGVEDQGWIAWFTIAALLGKPITIYGDGKQVRDILYIEDLIDAYQAVLEKIEIASGNIYNIGGGPENTISIWAEFGPLLEQLLGMRIQVAHGDWRPGDQRVYVSDIREAQRDLGWTPRTGVREGIQRLAEWVLENKEMFDRMLSNS